MKVVKHGYGVKLPELKLHGAIYDVIFTNRVAAITVVLAMVGPDSYQFINLESGQGYDEPKPGHRIWDYVTLVKSYTGTVYLTEAK